MEEHEGLRKRKNRLAVFEHVVEKTKSSSRRRKLVRLNSEDSSQSESELVIDDEPKKMKKKKKKILKLTEEPLSLKCEWNSCSETETYNSWKIFNAHLIEHADTSETLTCQWDDCGISLSTLSLFVQHMSYHAYLSKLINIGENLVQRDKLPKCKEIHFLKPQLQSFDYKCEWEYCSMTFVTIYDFLNHMPVHVKNNASKASDKEIISCCWKGCNGRYSKQTKLADHLKTHTKEKVIGCANCRKLFSNKTKFADHRKRQLSSDLQNYQCSQCLKLFPTERLLRDHMRSHVNHYKCTMCDMTCPKPSILAKHIRFKHINFKPYKCPTCNKCFVEKYNLNTHLRTHEDDSFKCYLCKYECRSKATLNTHYVKKHKSSRKVYECHCCKKKFRRGTYLTSHLTKLHNYHWPSGHSRFRYRKDEDGIFRLQTVRYESLEVTQEMLRSESMPASNVSIPATYYLTYEKDGYTFSISDSGESCVYENIDEKVVITINDVDEEGNVVNCEVMESKVLAADQMPEFDKIVVKENSPKENDANKKSVQEDDTGTSDTGNSSTILEYEMFKNNKF